METEEKPQIEQTSVASLNEERDRKAFLQDLNKFMLETGKPLSKVPIMGYKELDLFQLFREVQSFGGFNEVVKNVGTWSKIWKRLGNFDPSITDSSFRLKKNYERYLLEYEYKAFPDHKAQATEFEKQKKNSGLNSSGSAIPPDQSQPIPAKTRNSGDKPASGPTKIPIAKSKGKKSSSSSPKDALRSKSTVKMPLILGDLTIESLGEVVPHYPYVTDKHVWPIGYKSHCIFASMLNPTIQVRYTCEIVDGGNKPQFVVTPGDLLSPIISDSASGAWGAILKKISGDTSPEPIKQAKGSMRFGITHPVVSRLIRELPNAEKISVLDAAWKIAAFTDGSKKRSLDSDSSSDEFYSNGERSPKEMCVDEPTLSSSVGSSVDHQWSRDEMDDLESAVATLQALKNCGSFGCKTKHF